MIVFDLQCGNGHIFEGWFGSSGDFTDQSARGLLSCPICGAEDVTKAVMAPAIGAKSNQIASEQRLKHIKAEETAGSSDDKAAQPPALPADTANHPVATMQNMKEALHALAKAQEKALEKSHYVGKAFAETARAMHYGERDSAPVHGETSPEDARALLDEGIEIAPLPLPVRQPEQEN